MPNKEGGDSFAQYSSGNINVNSYQQQPSKKQQRRYATREESEATVPVFTTPQVMYIRRELNSIPRFTSSQPLHTLPSTQQPYSTTKAQLRTNYNSSLPSSPSSPLYKDAASGTFDF
ncbi:hypothetical protein BDF20DRAFT_902179 [Mycotypha africana]|uniref:uncharacterized protein n=1 Tax=Mycotypha africana TaxID=64632 RepID=UPI002301BC7C|nr:uncharacterized protein BDF20DRAFT_902179 [Mycotypha africana]KAI8967176.1 hypothetical protein BDF20DRAFT_902179 [Mycotypha africana]